MLTRIARLSTRRSWRVVAAAMLFVLVAGAIGGGVAENLTSGGFEDPSTESAKADEALAERFGTGIPNVILLVTAQDGDVDSPAAAAAGVAVTDELAAEAGVTDVVSYWSEGNAPPLRSDDGERALVLARIEGDDDAVDARIEELGPAFQRTGDGEAVTVEVGGFAQVFHEVGATIEEDLVTAEMIALPITLVLLVLIFGSLVAASLPLIVGVMSIIGTFFVLQLLSGVTDVSVYALNLTTALGLGLAIDYSLFIVSRYREELRAGHEPRAAVIRTVRTAGRTVTFNALTVAASLCAMLVFPIAFLRSFAYAGLAVAVLAGVFSVVVLPAILALLGHRVNAVTLWRRSVTPPEQGFWHRMAIFVMRRPIPVATAVIALLLVLGRTVPEPAPDPARRPGAAAGLRRAPGRRRHPRRVLVRGGRRAVGGDRGRAAHAGRDRGLRRRARRPARRGPGRRRHRHLLRRGRGRAVRVRAGHARPRARHGRPLRGVHRRRAAATSRSCPPSSRCRRPASTSCTPCETSRRPLPCWSRACRPSSSTSTTRCSTACRTPSGSSRSSRPSCCS